MTGVIEGTTYPPKPFALTGRNPAPHSLAAEQDLEINFRLDPRIYDGRFANNGWLQELPKPMTKLTWDNAVMVSPKLAEQQGLKNEDVVELELQGPQGQRAGLDPGRASPTIR